MKKLRDLQVGDSIKVHNRTLQIDEIISQCVWNADSLRPLEDDEVKVNGVYIHAVVYIEFKSNGQYYYYKSNSDGGEIILLQPKRFINPQGFDYTDLFNKYGYK